MQMNATQSQDRERFVKLGQHDIHYHYKDQTLYISPREQLKPYPQKLTDRLIHFAQTKPDHIFAAKRNAQGEWVKLSYAEVLQRAWHIAQALHDRNLSQERPLVILSGNDLEHLTLSMGAMLAGVPFSAISLPTLLFLKTSANSNMCLKCSHLVWFMPAMDKLLPKPFRHALHPILKW